MNLALSLLVAIAASADPCVERKDPSAGSGQVPTPFRTCFDPGERIEVSVGPGFGNQAGLASGVLTGVLRQRKDRASKHDAILWNRDHTLMEASLTLPRMDFQQPRVEVVPYQGVFIRRYEEGALVVPVGANPLRIPFPFDVGIEFESPKISYDRATPDEARLGLLRAAPLLDASRRIPGAYRFAFGPELAYSLGLRKAGEPRQYLQPFSGGVLDLRFESDDGLWVGTLQGHVGYELEVKGPGRLAWRAVADLERTLIAIDDRPLAPFVHFEAGADASPIRFVGQIGLRLAAPL
ncbi:MAG: hypothetical protein QM765_22870 [Myxococcales bacterium]